MLTRLNKVENLKHLDNWFSAMSNPRLLYSHSHLSVKLYLSSTVFYYKSMYYIYKSTKISDALFNQQCLSIDSKKNSIKYATFTYMHNMYVRSLGLSIITTV